MKQIEITIKVNNDLAEVDKILTEQGFNIIRKSRVEDKYLKRDDIKLDKTNIIEVLSKCALIRYLKVGNDEFKKITYKKKEYENNNVISETKINVNIDDTEKAYELLKHLGFELLVNVFYDVIVYEKDNLELAFQDVEGLGLLLEVENGQDFTGGSNEEILKEKKNMLEEINKYGLNISQDFDVKKAYELIKEKI